MDLTIVRHAVEADDGAKKFPMSFLKRHAAAGRSRLSRDLCDQISASLEALGLMTVPMTLPTSENEIVWIIQKDSVLGEAIQIASVLVHLDKLNITQSPSQLLSNYPKAKEGLSRVL
ncbi:hypothetical protein [Streptomyces laurentii]|uniref:hypothetical protein n=1 Tax=Streptomyces laurentii TaxID=39478 RepID=UPI0036C7F279